MQSNSALNTAKVKVEKIGQTVVRFTKTDGKELNIDFTSGFGDMGFSQSSLVDSVWSDLSYEANSSTPKGDVSEGTLWYNSDLKIEILKNVYNGTQMEWIKHAWSEDVNNVAPELQLRTGMPTTRKDGTSPHRQVTSGLTVTKCHIQQSTHGQVLSG